MKESEYWDNVCDGLLTNEKGKFVVKANWPKIIELSRWLLGHDFSDKSILEIGPGTGLIFNILRSSGNVSVYYGLEPGQKFREVSGKMFGLKSKDGKANKMPFDNDQFDVIFALDVLEHIHPDERKDSFNEISRVARLSAKMFINNPLFMGNHDMRFNFKFGMKSIEFLCEVSGFRIFYLQEYSIAGVNSGDIYSYQMIELRR